MGRYGRVRSGALGIGASLLLTLAATGAAGAQDAKTLVLWDKETSGATDSTIDAIIKGFEASHPGVTVQRVSKAAADYDSTILLGATGSTPPDIMEVPFGFKAMSPLVEAGALLPLDPYVTKYGWDQRFPQGLRDSWSFSQDGHDWGTGSLYGAAFSGEIVGVFYNKAKLAALGLQVPTSFEEFEAALVAAKAAGEVPIQYGDSEGWPGIMQIVQAWNPAITPDQWAQWVYGREGAQINVEPYVSAMDKLRSWAEAGYFADGYDAVGFADSEKAFADGTGVFFLNGSWSNSDLSPAMGDNLGFFLMPAVGGGPGPVTGSSGSPFSVSAKSANADLAAEFLDQLTGAEAANSVAAAGAIPAVPDLVTAKPAAGTIQADLFDAWNTARENDTLVMYPDAAGPLYDPLASGLQELMAGKIDGQKYLDTVQAAYDEFHSSR